MDTINGYIVKRLDSSHTEEVLAHFLRLDKDSIYTRFCSPLSEEAIKKYVSRINFSRDGIFGAFDENLNIIGLGECVIAEDKDHAEVGFSVEKDCQGMGIGSRLMERIVRYAKSMDKHHLEMVCLRTNVKSIHLAKKFGLKVQNSYEGESVAVIDMNNINPNVENFNEKVEDTFAYYALKQRQNINHWKRGQELVTEAMGTVFSGMIKMMTPKILSLNIPKSNEDMEI